MSRAWSADGRPVSIGIDVVEIEAVRRLSSHGPRRLARVFSPGELAGPARRLACVFAAKEAVFKALGRGWGQGMRWREVRIERLPGGGWSAHLEGDAARRLRELGGGAVEVSAAACRGHAVARAVVYEIQNPQSDGDM